MKKHFFTRVSNIIHKHKIKSILILVIVVIAGYYIYHYIRPTVVTPQYVLSCAQNGSITQTVTGTGQVSASNQLDIQSQVSGTIKSINITVGQHVNTGDLLATIDSTQALADLQTARIAMAKLTEAPKTADLTSAENSLAKSYSDGFNAVSNVFLDLPTVMTGMKDMFYGQSGFLSDQNSSYLTSTARTYRDTAGLSYDKANNKYMTVLQEYKSLTRSSATSSISQLIEDTYSLTKDVSQALQNTQNAITYIKTNQSDYQSALASAATTNVNAWSSQINSDLTGVLSAQNTIQSNTNALSTLINGADTLDIESEQLSLAQKERAYQNYFIRAPFDGIIGRISVNVYGQAGSATTIATLIGDNKIATISLNEIDAAKVKVGQAVSITFDAIENFTAVGTVSVVDLVGTVTQGVVTYSVKIAINTKDDQIRPGMSVNTTIITNEKNGVIVVPSSAVKTQGKSNYVQVFDSIPTNATSSRTRTITSTTAPKQQVVTVGLSDDTNTEIVSGLSSGEWVVTRTITTASAQTTTAPSILNSLGGNRAGATSGTLRSATTGR